MANTHIDYRVREVVRDLFGYYPDFPVDVSYGFDWVVISPTDPTRISGLARNLDFSNFPDEETYAEKGTYLKPGKFIKALFPARDNDEISRMAAKFKASMTGNSEELTKELQLSDTPSEVYGMSHASSGSTGSSCMRHLDANIFEIYDTSDDIQILYTVEDGLLHTRALLHNNVQTDDGPIKFMDRIYTTNQNMEAVYKKWAKDNGYHYKTFQNYDSCRLVTTPDGEEKRIRMWFDCDSYYSAAPYMDTFRWFCSCQTILHNDCDWCYEDELCETGGGTESGVLVESYEYRCEDCGCGLHYEDTYNLGYDSVYCEGCYYDNTVECEICEERHHSDNVYGISVVGEGDLDVCDACRFQMKRCSDCGDYSREGEEYRVENGTSYLYYCEDHLPEDVEYCSKHNHHHIGGCKKCKDERRLERNSRRWLKALESTMKIKYKQAVKNSLGEFIKDDDVWHWGVDGDRINVYNSNGYYGGTNFSRRQLVLDWMDNNLPQ